MRTRIALATAMAVSYVITSFTIHPAAAEAATGSPVVPPYGGTQAPTQPSINSLLWPQVVGLTLPTTAAGGHLPATAAAVAFDEAVAAAQAAAAAAPPPSPPPPPTDATSTDTADWQCIRIHESGDVYNDPGEPSGAYGILESTWQSFGYAGWPYEATPAQQDALALQLYNEYGWDPWSSAAACGL